MQMMSNLGAWMDPNLALTPLQWVPTLNGNQIFDVLRLFLSYLADPSPEQWSKIAFMFNLLGCHSDLHNCKSVHKYYHSRRTIVKVGYWV